MADPITVLTTISVGLKLVDQFRELALRFMGKKPQPPSASVEQAGDAIQIRQYGKVREIEAAQLKLDQWGDKRYNALYKRIKTNWDLYYEMYSELPGLAVDEKARINTRLQRIKGELCEDFRAMVSLYERALGTSLPDHYSLYEVCS